MGRTRRRSGVAIFLGQIAMAVNNFTVLLIAARSVDSTTFAWLATFWLVYAVLLTAQRTLVLEQLFVESLQRPRSLRWIATASGVLFALLVLTLGLIGIAAFGPGSGNESILVVATAVALIAADAERFAAMAAKRVGRLNIADALILFFSLAALVFTFAGVSAFPALGLTLAGVLCALTLLCCGSWRGPCVRPRHALASFVASRRSFLAWGAAQVVATNLVAQLVPLLGLAFVSVSDYATLRALLAVVSPITTPALALQPVVARSLAPRILENAVLARYVGRWIALAFPALILLTLLVSLSSDIWVPMVLADSYRPGPIVLPVVLGLALVYLGIPGGVVLRLRRLGRQMLLAQLAAVGVGIVAVVVLGRSFGITGIAWGGFVQTLASVLTAHLALARALRGLPPELPSATGLRAEAGS